MRLTDLAKTPELIKITIDNEDIVKDFGESLDFYCYDRQPMETFLKFASTDRGDFGQIAELMKAMVLDEQGNPVIKDGLALPSKVMVAAFTKLVEQLGK
jgi:hypothetical protein